MAKSRKSKEEALVYLTGKIPSAKSLIFVDYSGLTVEEATKIRKATVVADAEYLVIKKTLLRKAAEANGITIDASGLTGNVAVMLGYGDPISPAKIAHEFAQKSEHMKILGGAMDGVIMSKEQAIALAKLPSKEELLSKLVWTLNAPISGFVNVLAGNLRGLVTVLKAVAEQKA